MTITALWFLCLAIVVLVQEGSYLLDQRKQASTENNYPRTLICPASGECPIPLEGAFHSPAKSHIVEVVRLPEVRTYVDGVYVPPDRIFPLYLYGGPPTPWEWDTGRANRWEEEIARVYDCRRLNAEVAERHAALRKGLEEAEEASKVMTW